VREALEQVYGRHRQGLYTLALAITRCPAQAEDAVHDAFVRLWAARNGHAADPVAYIYAAVRNAAIDQVRGAKRRPAGAETSAMDAAASATSIFNGLPADPAVEAVTAEEHRQVREAVDALPADDREAIVLRVYGGLSFEQMAGVLGEPLPTVASRYRRALEKLSRRLQGQENLE
jgi:RNA polymerase sigma-70 factor, ECF subfamily